MTRRRVLLVDDEPDILLLYRIALDTAGFEVVETNRGADALALLSAEEVHVVVLDVRLPDMDGFDVLAEIRARHPDGFPRVLMCSAHSGAGARARALGSDGFLAKPFSPHELVSVVESAAA